jgi:hypothetical protein
LLFLTAPLPLWGCTGGPAGDVFPERDFVCAAGESPPCETTEPATTDADRTAEPGDELEGETHTYVVNLLTIPDGADGTSPGFNLDGIDSGEGGSGDTCEQSQPDYAPVASLDPDQVGIDNALIGVLATVGGFVGDFDVNTSLHDQIASGSLLLLIRVSGIDSYDYDHEVSLQFALAAVPGGGAPDIGDDGLLSPGQTFDVTMEVGSEVTGDIFAGRLNATADLLNIAVTIPMDPDPVSLALPISHPQVRFDISADGLANGSLGGVITLDDLISSAQAIPAVAEFCDGDPECPTVRGVLEQSADIAPSADDPLTCESLSVGLQFGGTTAVEGS